MDFNTFHPQFNKGVVNSLTPELLKDTYPNGVFS